MAHPTSKLRFQGLDGVTDPGGGAIRHPPDDARSELLEAGVEGISSAVDPGYAERSANQRKWVEAKNGEQSDDTAKLDQTLPTLLGQLSCHAASSAARAIDAAERHSAALH